MNSVIPVPKALDVSPEGRDYNYELFQQSWRNYEVATGLHEKTNEQRVATLLSIVGFEALTIYNAFHWEED